MDGAERHRPREMPEPPEDPSTGANVPHAPGAARTPRGAGRVRHPAHLHPDVRLRRAGFPSWSSRPRSPTQPEARCVGSALAS